MNVHVRLMLSALLLALSLLVGQVVTRHGQQEVLAEKNLPPVEFNGPVTHLPPNMLGSWAVGNTSVEVTTKTQVDIQAGPIVIGRWVRVRGHWENDRLYADHVVSIPNTSVPTTVDIHGIVQKVMGQIWIVSGHQIQVSPTTVIEGSVSPHAGVVASVEGYREGNLVRAQRITLKDASDEERDVEFLGRLEKVMGRTWIVNGLEVEVPSQKKAPPIGSLVGIQGHLSGTRVFANHVAVNVAPNVTLDGWLTNAQEGENAWDVLVRNGNMSRVVRVQFESDTPIDERNGLARPGARVEVLGQTEKGDIVRASFARVLEPRHAYVTGTVVYIPNDRFAYPWTVVTRGKAEQAVEVRIRIRPTTVADQPLEHFRVGDRVAISGLQQGDGIIDVLMISHSKR